MTHSNYRTVLDNLVGGTETVTLAADHNVEAKETRQMESNEPLECAS